MKVKHDRKQVIQKGIRLFCEQGFNNTGVDAICKETGMTKGAFYNAFQSKEGFLESCLAQYSQQNEERILQKLNPENGGTALERLEHFYVEMLEIQKQSNNRGCFVNNVMAEMLPSTPSIQQQVNTGFEGFLEQIVPTVKMAQEEGDLSNHLQAEQIAEILHTTFYGTLTRMKALKDTSTAIQNFKIIIQSFKNK